MPLNFPSNPPNGDQYTDNCGNVWVYDRGDNKWTITPPPMDLDPDNIWTRNTDTGKITPLNPGDDLDMAQRSGNIDIQSFPEAD